MKINLSHIQEQGLNCAIFDANSANDTDAGRSQLLAQLLSAARREGLRVDKAALAYSQFGRPYFYGDTDLVRFLVTLLENGGSFPWTHELEV